MDTDVPLLSPSFLELAMIPTFGAAAALLGLLLACCCGLMTFAAAAGRLSRALSHAQVRRVLVGTATSGVLSAVALYLGVTGMITGPASLGPFTRLLAAGFTLWPPLLAGCLGALIANAHTTNGHKPSRSLIAGEILADLFAWWIPRVDSAANGANAADAEPEFEITMASGEEVEAEEREYIENILELGDTLAQEVMTPRTDVVALDVNWPPDKILELVAGARHSRFPVYEENIDNVLGVLHLRNLLEFMAKGEPVETLDLRGILLECKFVPASRKIDDVLRDLQRHKGHLAVVLDEYGGTAGILTIEDLLEEIVGEIQDEYDDESKQVHENEDGSLIISAQMPLDDLNELLEINLVSEEVETLGGFITNHLGHIPVKRETVEHKNLKFMVLSVEKNRIGRVKVEKTT